MAPDLSFSLGSAWNRVSSRYFPTSVLSSHRHDRKVTLSRSYGRANEAKRSGRRKLNIKQKINHRLSVTACVIAPLRCLLTHRNRPVSISCDTAQRYLGWGGGHWRNISPFRADSQRGTQTPFRLCCFGNHMAIVGGRQENRQPPCLHACFRFFYYPGRGSEVAHLPGSKQTSDIVQDTLGGAQLLATPSRYQVNLSQTSHRLATEATLYLVTERL